MVLTRVLVLLLGAAVVAAAAESPAAVHLANNNAKFKQMLSTVGVDDKAIQAMNGILLAPSNAAVESFASSMGMTLPQLLSNKLLVDQVTAYHFLPDVRVEKDFKAPSMPLMTKTGEVHYIVRFYKDPKTNRAWLQDMQGNKVPLKQLQLVFGNLTIVPVDKVLMSGGYFKSFEDALKLHAQLSKAGDLLKTAGGQASIAAAADNATLLVPVDSAFDSSKVSVGGLNQADSRRVMQYHAITPARPAEQLQSGTKATLLSGHSVKVDAGTSGELKAPWSGQPVKKPVVTVTDESGDKADVTLFNIWAGKGVIHGINKVLQPKASAAVSTEKAPAQLAVQKPASTGSRHLLQILQDTLSGWHYQHRASNTAMYVPRKFINRQLLQSGPASQFSPDWSQQTNPASALLAQNTVGAAYASAQKLKNAFYGTPDSPGWVSGGRFEQWGVL